MAPKNALFTKEIECVLIDMVRQRPLLWDTTTPLYRRTDIKRQHWDEIADVFGPLFTGELVHKRFQSMESTFRANERRVRETKSRCSGSGTDDIKKPTWEYYEMLSFLRKTCTQSPNINREDNINLQCSSPIISAENSSNFDENSQLCCSVQSDTESFPVSSSTPVLSSTTVPSNAQQASAPPVFHFSTPLSPVPSPTPVSSPTPVPPGGSRPKNIPPRSSSAPKCPADEPLYTKRGSKQAKTNSSPIGEAVEAIKAMPNETIARPKLDHFDMLGSFIASKLRSLSPEQYQYYERELLQVLIKPYPEQY